MMKKVLPLFVFMLVIACVYVVFFWQPASNDHAMPGANPYSKGGDFSMQAQSGLVSLKDFRGKVVLIYFGYTMCPDICPTNLAMMSNAFMQLEETPEGKQILSNVQGIFISVDPQRDTLKRLAEYAGYFHHSILGLTSTPEVIKDVADRYGAAYQKVIQIDSATNYVVDHSSETYVVDPQGKLVERLPHAAPPEQILAAIRKYSSKTVAKSTE